MILKVKTDLQDSWNHYQGDTVNHHITDWNNEDLPPSTHRYIDKNGESDCIFIYVANSKKEVITVLTNKEAYLLNDDGKTIDKLI